VSGLFEELKRRNVFRVAVVYVIAAWLILQVSDIVFPGLGLPEWTITFVIALLGIGLPVALILAWAFEVTPEGIKKEKDVDRSQSITPTTGRRIDRTIIVLLVLAVGYFAADKFLLRDDAAPEPAEVARGEQSIAVLPFVNMSDDPANEYFSDGISEELLNVLVRVEGLDVASRTSSFAFKDSNQKIPEIASELGVDHILEGSVRKAGNQVRVTAQLIDVSRDRHLWSDTYDRELADIFAVQDEIANAIVEALKVTLGGGQTQLSTAQTDNVDAYNAYLQGLFLWNKRTAPDFEKAVAHYERAIELDQEFARAYSALAATYVLQPEYGGPWIDEVTPKAEAVIAKALELDPNSAEAYTSRAYMKERFQHRWAEAEQDYLKAIEVDPQYATAWQWYGEFQHQTRSPDFGLAVMQKAYELDPVSIVITHSLALSLEYNGRFEEAEQQWRKVMDMAPNWVGSFDNLAQLYLGQGRYDQAEEVLRHQAGVLDLEFDLLGRYLAGLRDPALRDNAIEAVKQMKALVAYDNIWSLNLFMASLGAREETLDMLEQELQQGTYIYLTYINVNPRFDFLREEPRFKALIDKLNLTEYAP